MQEWITQEIKEAKEQLWKKHTEDDMGYDGWWDHLPEMKPDDVEDIIKTISKWDFNDTDNAVFYYTKITTLEYLLYLMNNKVRLKLGDRIEAGDDLDGATLCDWCNMHFKGDGSLQRCNDCWEASRYKGPSNDL